MSTSPTATVGRPAASGSSRRYLGAGLHAMSEAVYERSSLPIREREVARMRIAQLNECHV